LSNIVTTGGSGFGLMTTLQELIEVLFQEQKLFRLTTAMNFLEKQSVFTALTALDEWK
jgi:hypothetical protein